MDVWLGVLLSFLLPSLLILLLHGRNSHGRRGRLPPGPPAVPVLGNLFWLWRSVGDVERLLRDFRARYGPIVTLRIGARPSIFIFDRDLAHRALVEHGATFSDRPIPLTPHFPIDGNYQFITSSAYGPLWRLLRRNLISEVLHPTRFKLHAGSREWVLGVLSRHLRSQAAESKNGTVVAVESFRFAMFSLLVLMCFGERLDVKAIRDIETMQRGFLLFLNKLNVLAFAPAITKHIFRGRVRTLMQMRRRQRELFSPLIEARREKEKKQKESGEVESSVYSYVDSLLAIRLPMEGDRPLLEEELLSLCDEFLNAGTDTTSTALQWIMANMVKHQDMQRMLAEEIERVVGTDARVVEEEDLPRMPYLKAVVLEGLRRHPPGHFLLPHTVTEDANLDGYLIPRGAAVNVVVAAVACDGEVWEDPMAFKPERFLAGGSGEGVDVTGTKEIKMMPFGAGRRICPGMGLAMLILEYFVANLVREFEWKAAVDGEEVDMTEKTEYLVVMKNPLRARITPRKA